MTTDDLRSWWLLRQLLTPQMSPPTVTDCVRNVGWLTTAGGQSAYLSVRARMPDASREAVDRAAVDGTPLIETIGPRGTTVLVPREDMGLALHSYRASFLKNLERVFRSQELTAGELRSLGTAIVRALEQSPLTITDIRRVVTHRRAGELGDVARRLGFPNGVSLALRDLTMRGIVRRFPADGRLDSATFMIDLLHPGDRPQLDESGGEDDLARKLVDRFLRWNGPATLGEIAWWADLTKTAAKAALKALGAESVSIKGWTDEAWLHASDVEPLRKKRAATDDRVVLLPFRDPFIYARRGPAVLAKDPGAPVLDIKSNRAMVGAVDSLHHHAIISGTLIVGVWEYAPAEGAVVTRLWTATRRLRSLVEEAAARTSDFIREELGDARFYAFDKGPARAQRLQFCRDT